jgi:WD40 repeat protein
MIAAAGADEPVRLWTLDGADSTIRLTSTRVPSQHAEQVTALSRDGTLLASTSGDNMIRLWSTANPSECLAELKHEGVVTAIEFNEDGKLLGAGSSTGYIGLWSVPNWQRIVMAGDHAIGDTRLKFLPSNFAIKQAVAATSGAEGVIRIWNAEHQQITSIEGREIADLLRFHSPSEITTLACMPDGSDLLWGGVDGSLTVARGWRVVRRFRVATERITGIAFCGLKCAVLGSRDNTAILYDFYEDRQLASLAHPAPVNSVACLQGHRILITGCDDGIVRLWNLNGHIRGAKLERTT